jgi:putative phosphoesterase
MRIAIASDSHDNIPNIQKFLDWVNKNNIERIIHCGDICAASAMREIGQKFNGPIYFILGNVSSDLETLKAKSADLDNVTIYYDGTGELEIDDKKIAFNHYLAKAEKLAKTGKYDAVFYGHSHKPWEKQIGQTKLLNPGTLGGMFYKATFAVYDTETDKTQLIILEKI